jgi:hypothetical protein
MPTSPGNRLRLRGTPIQTRGVGGTMPGTDPLGALQWRVVPCRDGTTSALPGPDDDPSPVTARRSSRSAARVGTTGTSRPRPFLVVLRIWPDTTPPQCASPAAQQAAQHPTGLWR